jgi:NADH:quinone reductase (non-electrogenic)
MFKTRVTEKLGIEVPIIGGTMMWLSQPAFVAAISEAGALGIVCSAMWKSKDEFRDALKKIKDLTAKPVAVNLNLFPAMRQIDNNVYLDVMVDEGIKIVETSGHKAPEELSARFKQAGLTWIHKCVGLRYAKKAVSLGADMITVVGYENGGATGVLDLGTLVLVNRVASALPVPVIGGGGVMDGRGLVALLALGAEGAIMGTRFLFSHEAPIHDKLKQALCGAQETDTVLVMRTLGNTHRIWKNERADLIVALEERKASLNEIVAAAAGEKDKQMFEQGDLTKGTISIGQGVGLCEEIKSCREIVAEIMQEAQKAAQRVGSISGG